MTFEVIVLVPDQARRKEREARCRPIRQEATHRASRTRNSLPAQNAVDRIELPQARRSSSRCRQAMRLARPKPWPCSFRCSASYPQRKCTHRLWNGASLASTFRQGARRRQSGPMEANLAIRAVRLHALYGGPCDLEERSAGDDTSILNGCQLTVLRLTRLNDQKWAQSGRQWRADVGKEFCQSPSDEGQASRTRFNHIPAMSSVAYCWSGSM